MTFIPLSELSLEWKETTKEQNKEDVHFMNVNYS